MQFSADNVSTGSPVSGPVSAGVQAPADQPPDALRVLLLVHLLDGVSAALVNLR